MRIALGPNLYYWSREETAEFYQQVAHWPLDIVYLGETVCSKRRPYGLDEWLEIARALTAAGKQVVLSTLTLIEALSELGVVKRLCDNGEFLVEANDLSAVQLLSERRLPFVTGPSVNIYNPRTLLRLRRLGLQRWVMPVELSEESLRTLLTEAARDGGLEGLETEVFSYGRLPLAYAARCFTARAHNLPKDNCQWKCQLYPDGLAMDTQEGENFLTINGIQTQSGKVYNLLGEWRRMAELGVEVMRISPQAQGTEQVVRELRGRLDGGVPEAALPAECNGYWYRQPGMAVAGA